MRQLHAAGETRYRLSKWFGLSRPQANAIVHPAGGEECACASEDDTVTPVTPEDIEPVTDEDLDALKATPEDLDAFKLDPEELHGYIPSPEDLDAFTVGIPR